MTLATALGCSSGERENAETGVEPVLPDGVNLGACSAAWVPLTGGNGGDSEPPVDLLFSRGHLYFYRFTWGPQGSATSELVRFAVTANSGDTATTVMVPNTYSAPMWIDDNELVFTQNSEVRSVPLAGGDVRVRSSYASDEVRDVQWLGIVDNDFYFARYGKPGAIWRVGLEGGPIELFTELGEDWGFPIEPPLVSSPEGLLLNGRRQGANLEVRQATVLIGDDGVARDLPYPDGAAAAPQLTPTGIIHTMRIAGEETTEEEVASLVQELDGEEEASAEQEAAPPEGGDVEMRLSPIGGGDDVEFWSDRPLAAIPGHVESDGQDGWFVTASEPFNDGYRHDTLWHVRPNLDSRRLGCNPSPETSRIHTTSRTGKAFAFGEGFVYLVSSRSESEFWELVKVSYQPPGE